MSRWPRTFPARHVFAAALLLTSTACQPDLPEDPAKLAVFDIGPRQRTVSVDPGRLIAMTPDDIRRSAMTCLQSPPYPPDGGPMCLRPDGSWITYSGWGNPQGRYTITGNEVRMEGGIIGGVQRLAFYRRADGRLYLRDLDPPAMPASPIEPFSEADYLNGV